MISKDSWKHYWQTTKRLQVPRSREWEWFQGEIIEIIEKHDPSTNGLKDGGEGSYYLHKASGKKLNGTKLLCNVLEVK